MDPPPHSFGYVFAYLHVASIFAELPPFPQSWESKCCCVGLIHVPATVSPEFRAGKRGCDTVGRRMKVGWNGGSFWGRRGDTSSRAAICMEFPSPFSAGGIQVHERLKLLLSFKAFYYIFYSYQAGLLTRSVLVPPFSPGSHSRKGERGGFAISRRGGKRPHLAGSAKKEEKGG